MRINIQKAKEQAPYFVCRMLENGKKYRILSYFRAYIHLGLVQYIPDVFTEISNYLPRYDRVDSSHFTEKEIEAHRKTLCEIYDMLF